MICLFSLNATAMITLVLPPERWGYQEPAKSTMDSNGEEQNQPAQAPQNIPPANSNATVPESPNKALYDACINYLAALDKGLGCGCCKWIQNALQTPKAIHIKERIKEVTELVEFLLAADQDLDAFRNSFQKMETSQKGSGKLFATCCKMILDNNSQNKREINDDSDEGLCILCMNSLKEICYLPCRHLVYDNNCYQNLKPEFRGTCPICRSNVTATIRIKICMACFKKPAEMVSLACGHAAICEECNQKAPKDLTCKYCHTSTTFEKIFID